MDPKVKNFISNIREVERKIKITKGKTTSARVSKACVMALTDSGMDREWAEYAVAGMKFVLLDDLTPEELEGER